jgi:hypothetical protein
MTLAMDLNDFPVSFSLAKEEVKTNPESSVKSPEGVFIPAHFLTFEGSPIREPP